MRLRSAASLLILGASTALAQGRTIDEGTFLVTRTGSAPVTENFRIVRGDDGGLRATARAVSGTRRVTSTLLVDSAGSPIRYDVVVLEHGDTTAKLAAAGRPGRITAQLVNARGDESMREYPLGQQRCMILEDGLLHELYFAALGSRTGSLLVVSPRDSRSVGGAVTAGGLENVEIAGRSVTGTRYSLTSGSVRRDFWVDSSGRLLKVSIPSEGLTAVREEPPR